MNNTAANAATDLAAYAQLKRRLPSPAMRRAIRANAGVSASDVAKAIGVTRNAVGHWERGERTPRGPLLAAYIDVLDQLQGAVV